MITCKNLACRATYPDGTKFCPQCGASTLLSQLASPPPPPPPPPPPHLSRANLLPTGAAPFSPADVKPLNVENELSKPGAEINQSNDNKEDLEIEDKTKQINRVLIYVFGLIFFIVFLFWLISSPKSNQSQTPNTTSPTNKSSANKETTKNLSKNCYYSGPTGTGGGASLKGQIICSNGMDLIWSYAEGQSVSDACNDRSKELGLGGLPGQNQACAFWTLPRQCEFITSKSPKFDELSFVIKKCETGLGLK